MSSCFVKQVQHVIDEMRNDGGLLHTAYGADHIPMVDNLGRYENKIQKTVSGRSH